jgi:hypothetical protein
MCTDAGMPSFEASRPAKPVSHLSVASDNLQGLAVRSSPESTPDCGATLPPVGSGWSNGVAEGAAARTFLSDFDCFCLTHVHLTWDGIRAKKDRRCWLYFGSITTSAILHGRRMAWRNYRWLETNRVSCRETRMGDASTHTVAGRPPESSEASAAPGAGPGLRDSSRYGDLSVSMRVGARSQAVLRKECPTHTPLTMSSGYFLPSRTFGYSR